jgi:hypothetical protein
MHHIKDPADTNRCKGPSQAGQCLRRSVPGSEFCEIHGGTNKIKQKEELRSYLLTQVDSARRLAQLQDSHDPVRELRDAISLTHLLIERRMNLIQTDADLMVACSSLKGLIETMDRLVNSATRIEQHLGQLLSKDTVLNLGQLVVNILIDELDGVPQYEAIVDRVTSKMLQTITVAVDPVKAKG